jgi:hypothetical protein
MENKNGKLPFVCCERKWKTDYMITSTVLLETKVKERQKGLDVISQEETIRDISKI